MIKVFAIQRLFCVHNNLSGPTNQSVIEISAIRSVCYKRFHCIESL